MGYWLQFSLKKKKVSFFPLMPRLKTRLVQKSVILAEPAKVERSLSSVVGRLCQDVSQKFSEHIPVQIFPKLLGTIGFLNRSKWFHFSS